MPFLAKNKGSSRTLILPSIQASMLTSEEKKCSPLCKATLTTYSLLSTVSEQVV